MACAFVFELIGALTVGARTASTIKSGIISAASFQDNAGVQLLAFACAAAGAGTWVMFCSSRQMTVSSTYALVSSLVGVGIATGGAKGVQWAWNGGEGVGAIFAGLLMAPVISGCFGAIIFTLIKVVVHTRRDPVRWAVWTSPFFFLIAGTICTLTIVYKGSPRLGLSDKPAWYIAAVTLGVGWGLCAVSALFFMPYVHARVLKKDYTLKSWEVIKGPLLWSRQAPADASVAKVPNYAVIQHGDSDSDGPAPEGVTTATETSNVKSTSSNNTNEAVDNEKGAEPVEMSHARYQAMMDKVTEDHHAYIRTKRNPLGWAMRVLHNNPIRAGGIYELHNILAILKRIPAYPVVALLYGTHYDIHAAQLGVQDTPDGRRMARTYAYAVKYENEVEFLYSFVQIITACTASFAHGANDVGNAVGVWAGMYAAWSTGRPAASKEEVPLWQIAVMVLTLCFGFMTYGYNIMKGMSPPITCFDIQLLTPRSHGQQNHVPLPQPWLVHGNGRCYYRHDLLSVQPARLDHHVHHGRYHWRWSVQRQAPRRQLAPRAPRRHLLGSYCPHGRSHRWLHHGSGPQHASL